MVTDKQNEELYDQGYFVTDNAVPEAMLERMVAAAVRATDKVRSGAVVIGGEKVEVDGEGSDAEHIEGVFAPEFDEPVFAEYMCCDELLNYVTAYLGDEIRLGWMTLCVNGPGYDSGWHRDLGGKDRDASCEVEMELLRHENKNRFKWSLALKDDPCLLLMPGSQRRYRTDEEWKCLFDTKNEDISGQQEVFLKKGETMFWNGNIIHRGRAPDNFTGRLTVRAGMSKYLENEGVDDLGNRFQWMQTPNVRASLPEKLHLLYDRWLAVQPPN